ncbi:MAG: cytochrome C, partial [Ruegeria sp.]
MKRILVPALFGLLAVPAFAEGDAEAGKKTFNKCKSCHLV